MFGALLLLGMVFWIPPLLRATAWDDPTLETNAAPLGESGDGTSPAADSAAALKPIVITLSVLPAAAWQTVNGSLHRDPREHRADSVGLSTAIFQSDRDTSRVGRIAYSEGPASDADLGVSRLKTPVGRSNAHPQQVEDATLILSTTILGKTRRAAVINGRLCREGDELLAGGETYRLASVALDHVELICDARTDGDAHRVVRLMALGIRH